MDAVNDNGFAAQMETGQLGAAIYKVVTGKKCKINLIDQGEIRCLALKVFGIIEGYWVDVCVACYEH